MCSFRSDNASLHHFPATRWSLVARVGHVDTQVKRAALAEVLRAYVPALRSHLVIRKRIPVDRADDLLQGFLSNKVLEEELIPRAERERGKFRSFLLTALDRFVLNQVEYERAKKRVAEGGVVSVDDALEHPEGDSGPADAFDVAWARQVLNMAVARMRAECESSGRGDVWGVFTGRVLAPTLEGAEPVAYEDLIRQFALRDVAVANNLVTTGKRMYARQLKAVVSEYEPDASLEQEVAELKQILARRRG